MLVGMMRESKLFVRLFGGNRRRGSRRWKVPEGEQMSNNEQWNAQLKKLSGDGPLEGVISNHCTINPKDVELLESLIKAAPATPKITLENR